MTKRTQVILISVVLALVIAGIAYYMLRGTTPNFDMCIGKCCSQCSGAGCNDAC